MLDDALVGVNQQGVIQFLDKDIQRNGKNVEDVVGGWGWGGRNGEWELVKFEENGRNWYFPGFIGR